MAGKLFNQLDTSHKHKPHQSFGLTMDKQSEQGSEAEKKIQRTNAAEQTEEPVPSTARGKLERKM